MGFFSKKKKGAPESPVEELTHKTTGDPKKKSDKMIRSSAPRGTAGRKFIRALFWLFVSFVLVKGVISFAQGNRTIYQTVINGETEPVVSDSVKGFATDFAVEYFTWNANFVEERNKALAKFVKDIDSDISLKAFDTKVSSKVTNAEVYSTRIIDPSHVDVTVVVWRDVQPLPDQILAAQGTAPAPEITMDKSYIVVPVTLAADGPVITTLPRFVSETPKGSTGISSTTGSVITDPRLLQQGKELADSYLRSWYEGNASQIKYFYAEQENAPAGLQMSEFMYDKLDRVTMYQVQSEYGETPTYSIEASVIVKSELDEIFKNSWSLTVTQKDGQLYVISNGNEDIEKTDVPPTDVFGTTGTTPGSTEAASPTDPTLRSAE